ncbi:MAG: type II toxin-antitoxin system VapC family toxin [Burkholderiales bacterium]
MVKLIVPDASVLLKWVLPEEREPYAAQAVAVRDAFIAGHIRLLVPALWFYEVGNVLVTHFADSAAGRLATLAAFRIPEARPTSLWRERILKLTAERGVTFYDASYHALADVSDGIFVTADAKYLRKAGPDSRLLSLASWPPR